MTTVDFPDELPPGGSAQHPSPLQAVPASIDAAGVAAVAALPLLELPAGPEAPLFDGTQLCAQVDPELFFPDKGGSVRSAKQLCGVCEFLTPCRRYAMTAWVAGYPVSGVWGGTSETDRRHLRRAAAAAAAQRVEVLDDLLDHLLDEEVA